MMDCSLALNEDENSGNILMESQCLEFEYHESTWKIELAVKDEESRRLRLQILLLEDDNDQLYGQLAVQDDTIGVMEDERETLQKQLEEYEQHIQRQEIDLRAQARELKTAKTELNSMNGLSVDTANLLTEKLSLARELSTLRPELDHLRAQASHQQAVLAEKLALQRQLSTLEVELEAAKNASRRATTRNSMSGRENELLKQCDELRQQISQEKREKEKTQKQAEKESQEWEASKAVLESKLEATRSKVRDMKGQMKSLQTDLVKAQATHPKVLSATQEDIPVINPRKRNALDISRDASIGTPDGVAVRGRRAAGKKGHSEQSILGEKSTFSITPYLNRTISNAADTPQNPELEERAQINKDDGLPEMEQEDSASPSKKIPPQPAVVAQSAQPSQIDAKVIKPNVLKESNVKSLNAKGTTKKSRKLEFLEKVNEEGDDENEEPKPGTATRVTQNPRHILGGVANGPPEAIEPKKKKRKLLGSAKTIFDEEDAESTKRPSKIVLGPPKSLGRPGGNKRTGLGLPTDQPGGFSPLKKDRRGAQASFLG